MRSQRAGQILGARRHSGAARRAQLLGFAAANVPLGWWTARGYFQAAAVANAVPAGQYMGLVLQTAGVALVLTPPLVLSLVLTWTGKRRAGAACAVIGCAIGQGVLLADSTVYHLTRFHIHEWGPVRWLLRRGALAALGITEGTVWWAAVWAAGLLAAEGALWLVLGAVLRATRLAARVGAAVRHAPAAVSVGVPAALLLPALAIAAYNPRGPLLETGRHFLIPLAPSARRESLFSQEASRRLGALAAARQPPGPAERLPLEGLPLQAAAARPWNVVLLIVESLRADAVTPQTMPRVAALAGECVVAENHVVEGNCTHHSIYTLASGLHPAWYGLARQRRATPVPLALLRSAGYGLHLAAAAPVDWVGMADAVFPPRLFESFLALAGDPVANDCRVAERLRHIVRSAREPFLAVGLFNSTHFVYFYPPDEEHFRPVLDTTITAFNAYGLRGHREELRNRYRNAARYVDRLIGQVADTLRRDGLLERTVLVIAGDHGESLLEEGLVVHGNAFHPTQTRAPLLIRYPSGRHRRVTGLSQHADLLPSLFAELGLTSAAVERFPGFRTLRPEPDERRPWAVTAMAAPHTPVEYLLLAPDCRIEFSFNIEPLGRIVLEARQGTGSAERAASAIAAWLDHQRLLPPSP